MKESQFWPIFISNSWIDCILVCSKVSRIFIRLFSNLKKVTMSSIKKWNTVSILSNEPMEEPYALIVLNRPISLEPHHFKQLWNKGLAKRFHCFYFFNFQLNLFETHFQLQFEYWWMEEQISGSNTSQKTNCMASKHHICSLVTWIQYRMIHPIVWKQWIVK